MRRRLLLGVLLLPAALVGGFHEWATPHTAQANADCTTYNWFIAANSSGVSTWWDSFCNEKWNLTLVLQYRDPNGLWHTALCTDAANNCRRQKPSDGSWFYAHSEHTSNDDWNVTTPATICTHPFRLRFNYHFQSGAGGITFDTPADTTPCS